MRHVAREGDKVVGEAVGGHPVVNPFILAFVGANTARERHGIQKRQILATLSPSALLTAEPNAAISAHFEIVSAHVCTLVTNAHLVCRLLLEKKTKQMPYSKI